MLAIVHIVVEKCI